ncbi:MAG: Unknown protein [uncultured Sulfurovum sp.]|uniref:Uncharacterized protein n=1 Tax=uncultured Sulfurovum sp. TaxID=269237 RepID=A0A6S6UBV6_9BACT|nr:MAG: Unknown protein [uncultured Sulfurovum sp.]
MNTDVWQQYAANNKRWIKNWVNVENPLPKELPLDWINLVNNPTPTNLKEIWKKTNDELPRFLDYLCYAILDAKIAMSRAGYILVYHLKEWEDLGTDGVIDGFMITGLPTKEKTIVHFENNLGKLPLPLRNLWLTHGFISFRDDSFLTSIIEEQQVMVSAPYPYFNRENRWKKGHSIDCLAISNINSEIMSGISKEMNTKEWKDELVDVMKYGKGCSESLHVRLDDLLTDTSSLTWLNPGWRR